MATTPLIEVTPVASERLEKILAEQGEDGSLLRVMVTPGPHGGFQYMLGVEKEAGANDFIVDTDTIQVLVDAESAPLIEGAQIDYVDGLMRSGFVISNPNFQGEGDAPVAVEAEEAAAAVVAVAVAPAGATDSNPAPSTRD